MGRPALSPSAISVLSARSSTGLIPIKAVKSVSPRWTDPDAGRSGRLRCLGNRHFHVSQFRGHATPWTGRSGTRRVVRVPSATRSSNVSLRATPLAAVTRCPDASPGLATKLRRRNRESRRPRCTDHRSRFWRFFSDEAKELKEKDMRGWRRRNGSQWRETIERRVRITEPRVRCRAGEQKNGLMLLGERVADAYSK